MKKSSNNFLFFGGSATIDGTDLCVLFYYKMLLFSLSLEFQFTGEMIVFALLVYLMNEDFLGPSGELSSYIVLFVIGAYQDS